MINLFHISGFLSSVIVGLTSRAVNKRTTKIFFVFPFVQRVKEKLNDSVFMTFKKEKKLRETDNGRENDVKFNIPPIDAALETPLALALTILFCNLMKR